jgi:hypothetical protein
MTHSHQCDQDNRCNDSTEYDDAPGESPGSIVKRFATGLTQKDTLHCLSDVDRSRRRVTVNNPSAFWTMRHKNPRNRPQNEIPRSAQWGESGPGAGMRRSQTGGRNDRHEFTNALMSGWFR